MDETYRMLGGHHDTELLREADGRHRVAELERSGGITRADAHSAKSSAPTPGRLRTALRRYVVSFGSTFAAGT